MSEEERRADSTIRSPLTVSIVQADRTHARDTAIVGAALGQVRAAGVIDAGDQADSFEGRHGHSLGAITGFRVVGRQAVFHALRYVNMYMNMYGICNKSEIDLSATSFPRLDLRSSGLSRGDVTPKVIKSTRRMFEDIREP